MSRSRLAWVVLWMLVASSRAGAQVPDTDLVANPALWRDQLLSPEVETRRWAAQWLARDPSPQTRRALAYALATDPDSLVRATCAWTLAAICHPDSLEALWSAARHDPDPAVQHWAAFAARRIDPGGSPGQASPRALPATEEEAPVVVEKQDQAPPPEPAGPLYMSYLRGLAGLEFSYFGGRASVDTSYKDATGADQTIANGKADSQGYRIAFYGLPKTSGFFLYPSLGFVSQDITLKDFREHVPSYMVPNAETIPAVTSDPNTGARVDAEEPNTYRLHIRSIYLGQRLGITKVWDRSWMRAAITLQGIVNLVERRDLQYQIGSYDSNTAPDVKDKTSQTVALQSGGGAAGFAIGFKKLHFALRGEIKYEAYRHFEFPKAVEFRGPVHFNSDPAVMNFERDRLFLRGVDYQAVDGQVSASLFF